MKKLFLFMMTMLLLAACSAPMPSEDVGEVQEALGTCPRPTGGKGDTSGTADGYVTSIQADAAQPWRFKVYYRVTGSLFTSLGYVDFGGVSVANSHANITGPGWASVSGSRVDEVMVLDHDDGYAISAGCPNDPNLKCMMVSVTGSDTYVPVLYFNKGYSSPGSIHVGTAAGLTAIYGMGATLPQKLRFYFDYGTVPSTIGYSSRVIEGPMLDACATP